MAVAHQLGTQVFKIKVELPTRDAPQTLGGGLVDAADGESGAGGVNVCNPGAEGNGQGASFYERLSQERIFA